MRYGSLEYQYAEPIARALVEHKNFAAWVLSRSKFSDAPEARVLREEMMAHRRNAAAEWWRFYFTEGCRCLGCSGKETDIFAVFQSDARRFAMHFEVKQPTDKFKADGIQSRGYPLRANCWAMKSPPKVLPHHDASTGIFFSERKRAEYAPHLVNFDAQITFEEIENEFPYLAKWKPMGV